MSRIAKYPVAVPKGVEVDIAGGSISVKGPLGTIARAADPNVALEKKGDSVEFKAVGNSNHANAMSGTMRALVAGMVTGVTKGFEKRLALVGVGFRAQAQGDKLQLSLGYSHPIVHQMPKGIKVATPTQTEIVISGIDKQLVGQVAAEVRAHRPPEPYKGKGVRHRDELIVLKETKKK
jgi:large subunit ribosomal protein L6